MLNRIRQIAESQPDALAMMSGARSITYAQLMRRVFEVAHWISDKRLNQKCVAIALSDKSEEVIYALGALYSGNYFFFVPHQIQDDFSAQVPISLFISDLPQFSDISTPPRAGIYRPLSDSNFDPKVLKEYGLASHYCCVFVTSGSSGLAKYALHDFQSIQEDTYRQVEENLLSPSDRVDFLFAASFSSSLASIFPTFCAGGTLVIHDIEPRGLTQIPDFWNRQGVTFTTLTSSAFRTICRIGSEQLRERTKSIRFLCLGGEPVRASDAELIRTYFPENTQLQLAYASTETRAIASLTCKPSSESLPRHDGFAVRKKKILLLDPEGNPCGPGELGEIAVKSAYISLGYYREKGLRLHPLDGEERFYLTGDRGIVQEDGTLILSGRVSAQQKVNGHLVDLAKVEEVILSYLPESTQCKLLKVDDAKGLDVLVAFLTGSSSIPEAILRARISAHPEFLVKPRRYLWLKEFPLNSHGKVDREQLSRLARAELNRICQTLSDDSLVGMIKEAWTAELGVEIDNLDADFFTAFGGTSLGAEIVMQDISERLGESISATVLQDLRSIRKLSEYLLEQQGKRLPALEVLKKSSDESAQWLIFLDNGYCDSFLPVVANLSGRPLPFHMACLRLDFYEILESQNFELQFSRWTELIKGIDISCWVGISFNGWLAAKFAQSQGGQVVIFDSPCYGAYDSKTRRNFWKTRLSYLKNTWEKEALLISVKRAAQLVRRYLSRKYQSKGNVPSQFLRAVNSYLTLAESPQFVDDLLYFYSTKSLSTSSRDIEGWKKKTRSHFALAKIEGGHLDGCSEGFANQVSEEILSFYKVCAEGQKLHAVSEKDSSLDCVASDALPDPISG